MVKLGQRAKDSISGFEGIVDGRTEYLNGCVKIHIEPDRLEKDGKVGDGYWFDEQRVVPAKGKGFTPTREVSATAGGPQKLPPRG